MSSSRLSPQAPAAYYLCIMVFVELLVDDPYALYLALWAERNRRDRERDGTSPNEANSDVPMEDSDAG